jgi:hypothetical protein
MSIRTCRKAACAAYEAKQAADKAAAARQKEAAATKLVKAGTDMETFFSEVTTDCNVAISIIGNGHTKLLCEFPADCFADKHPKIQVWDAGMFDASVISYLGLSLRCVS